MKNLDIAQKAVFDYREACGGVAKMTDKQFAEFRRLAQIVKNIINQSFEVAGLNSRKG